MLLFSSLPVLKLHFPAPTLLLPVYWPPRRRCSRTFLFFCVNAVIYVNHDIEVDIKIYGGLTKFHMFVCWTSELRWSLNSHPTAKRTDTSRRPPAVSVASPTFSAFRSRLFPRGLDTFLRLAIFEFRMRGYVRVSFLFNIFRGSGHWSQRDSKRDQVRRQAVINHVVSQNRMFFSSHSFTSTRSS